MAGGKLFTNKLIAYNKDPYDVIKSTQVIKEVYTEIIDEVSVSI